MNSSKLEGIIQGIPKTELHLHLEGSFEPELMLEIAHRNNVELPFDSIEEVKKHTTTVNLNNFIKCYFSFRFIRRKA